MGGSKRIDPAITPSSKLSLVRAENDPSLPEEMIGTCPAMRRVFDLIRKVATADIPILVTGASGTGKEMVAQAIHQRSLRADGTFVALNCGAVPRELLESELFGHERGAFTGAYRTVIGKAELANNGTLFLDEVGELPLELQVKLLRFLQEFSFERVGGRENIHVNLHLISATNCDLQALISKGRFREDLYYRLNGINIALPDLKERGEDVLIMARVFLLRFSAKLRKEINGYTLEAIKGIRNYHWPGNVRELLNNVRRAVVMAEGPWITAENLGLENCPETSFPYRGMGFKEAKAKFESELVVDALTRSSGNVQSAAKMLHISRSVMYSLINRYELKNFSSSNLISLILILAIGLSMLVAEFEYVVCY